MTATFVAPDNPGVDVSFVGEKTLRPSVAAASTIGIPFTSDWGPVNELIRMNGFGEHDAAFGNSATPGRQAVLGGFVGPGIAGNPGAGSIVGYRMATGDAKASTKTVKTAVEEGEGEDALKLSGKYLGTRGDRISFVIEADPADPSNRHRLRLLFDGLTVESYRYPKADIESVVAQVNKLSRYVAAELLKDGAALALTAGTSLAGGDDGDEVTAEEWLAAISAFEWAPITVLAAYALSDEAIQASVVSWQQDQAKEMKPIGLVFGGAKDENLTEAIERTEAYDDERVVSLGAGNFNDELLGTDISTAELTARVAGALAGLGEEKSLTNLRFAGLSIVGDPEVPTDQLKTAAEAGITAFKRTSSEEAELKVAKGVTSYLGDTNEKPAELYSDPRIIRVMDIFIREIVEWGEEHIVGPTRVNETSRAAVKAHGEGMLNDRLDRGLILPGATDAEKPYFTVLDPAAVGAPEDSIPFEFGWKFARTTNFMIGRGKVL